MPDGTANTNLLVFFVFTCLLIDGLLVEVIVPIFPDVIHGMGGDEHFPMYVPTSNVTGANVIHGIGADGHLPTYLPTSNVTGANESMRESNAGAFAESTTKISILFTADNYLQVLLSPWIGNITFRIGSNLSILIGLLVIIFSSAGFIFGTTYVTYLISRAVFGISSSILHVLGEAILADRISDGNGRGRALAIALFGAGVGSLVGPIMGGTLYQNIGMWAPFLVIILLTVCTICLQFVVLPPKLPNCSSNAVSNNNTDVMTVLKDPYIMIPIASIFVHEIYYCVILTALPVWMMETLGSDPTDQGIMVTAFELAYCLLLIPAEKLSCVTGRWMCIILGLLSSVISASVIPFCPNFYVLLIPCILSGVGSAMMDGAVMPLLGEVADKRHGSEFDTMYGVEVSVCCLGMLAGTLLTSIIVTFLGFKWVMWITALIYCAFIPLMAVMRSIPERGVQEELPQIDGLEKRKEEKDTISETDPILSR